jgi:hypothetical protein
MSSQSLPRSCIHREIILIPDPHGEVTGTRAFENPIHIHSCRSKHLCIAVAVGHQSAQFHVVVLSDTSLAIDAARQAPRSVAGRAGTGRLPSKRSRRRRRGDDAPCNDAACQLAVGLIRFRGQIPKGGYDVHDGRHDTGQAGAPALQRRVQSPDGSVAVRRGESLTAVAREWI